MEKTRRRLGRGLEALLGPATVAEARADGSLTNVSLSIIRPNPYQPRHAFDEEALDELKTSLQQSGLLQPIIVRPAENGAFELIAGERRCRAAQLLGWTEISALVKEVDDRTLLTFALVENLQRDALSPIDEASGYQRMIEEFGASQSEVADLVGRGRSTVANALRLLRLPDKVRDLVHVGKLSTGHARALLQVSDQKTVPNLAERIVTDRLSVRETEAMARGKKTSKRRPRYSRNDSPQYAHIRRVEDTLRTRLGTDVFVAMRGKGSGRVTINFYSNDDLARILGLVLGEPFDG
ncbi:MAG: ParB/RepB/Spo0J family partition protein [Gemmatimonadetes bacterium]|nr:ParB/RepB/Spo0J family partition protein [Gemmatimonadota bacterium]